MNKKVIIIGAGIAGPAMAIQLYRMGIEAEVFESRIKDEMNEGLFLGLTPNGLNVLSDYIDTARLYQDYTPCKMKFINAKGKEIGLFDTSGQKAKYGAATIQIKRATVGELLRQKAADLGVNIHYGRRLTSLHETISGVKASFDDGSVHQADVLIACDGTHSRCRNIIFPYAPQPAYTQQLSTGAICDAGHLVADNEAINMIFGKRAFFAFAKSNRNQVWWFNNFFREKLPSRHEVQTSLQTEIKNQLLDMHKDDPAPILDVIGHTDHIFAYPVFEMPPLDAWHTKRICLIGDAAHATAPHIGQGASLALEDTVVLAKCMKKFTSHETAFQQFQKLRKPRVEKIVKQARKVGNAKSKPNPFATFFRDLLLKYFIQFEKKKMDWVYSYEPGKAVI